MANLTAPGVYVEEISSGVRPIEAAGTSTAAFFGEAERGPMGEPVKVFNFTEFQRTFGRFPSPDEGRYLAYAVYQFFNNGGSACYVVRVAKVEAAPAEERAVAADLTLNDRGDPPQESLTLSASSAGEWGNDIAVVVDSGASSDPANLFNVTVHREPAGPDDEFTELESFVDLGMDPNASNYVETVLEENATYLSVEVNTGNTNVINGYSLSDAIPAPEGTDPYLTGSQTDVRLNLNGDGVRTVTVDLSSTDLTDLSAIAGAIQGTITALSPLRTTTPEAVYADATVTLETVEGNDHLRITVGGDPSRTSSVQVLNATDGNANLTGALRLGVRNGGTEVRGVANLRPVDTPASLGYYYLGDATVAAPITAVTLGADNAALEDADFVASFNRLDTIDDVSLLAVPGIGSPALTDAAMNYCRNRHLSDCFFIGDMGALDDTLEDAKDFRSSLNGPNSYGAVYFPWVEMLDPTGASSEPIAAPPSGFMAGLYSRIDAAHGVWKAPAGTEAYLGGAVGLTASLTEGAHGDLNNDPKSVSVIRKFPDAGIVAWGARTVSSNPEYKYIPIRRTAIMLRVSIHAGITWAVFEPNDEPLWAQLRLNIGSFMNRLFLQGAFQGSTPSEAYFVKCDAETTTQADINAGIVNVQVGFAPLKPAEFVVVQISQMAGQAG